MTIRTSCSRTYSGIGAVSISVSTPSWCICKIYDKLKPSWSLVKRYKEKSINKEQYTEEYYRTVLNKLDRNLVIQELIELVGDNIVLLCWCSKNDFCHRHLVAEWLDCGVYEI